MRPQLHPLHFAAHAHEMRFASESIWNAVRQVTRGERFVHLAKGYSGDILFDERRYPGMLARIIALDAAFRSDTNANCLDDDIVDMRLDSRLYEIESIREQGL